MITRQTYLNLSLWAFVTDDGQLLMLDYIIDLR